MAQKWREGPNRQKTVTKPLSEEALESLALHYVSRFATSRGKLMAYLVRKLRERGWEGQSEAPVARIADRLVALRYVDDAAYAELKSDAMLRRGLGARRIAQKLAMDGIVEEQRIAASPDALARWHAADRLAKRRRVGPYGDTAPDRAQREKQIAVFLRAGHSMTEARIWVDASPGEPPEPPSPED